MMQNLKNRRTFFLMCSVVVMLLFCMYFVPMSVLATEGNAAWPREIVTTKGVVVLYQPQVESFKNDVLSSRLAISINTNEEQIFGTVWVVSDVDIDRDARMAYPKNIRVPRAHFSNSTPAQEAALSAVVEEAATKWDLSLSIDRIIPMLELAETEELGSKSISTDPPRIVFEETPSVLVAIDGKPIFREIENSKVKQIVNTSFVLLFDESSSIYYLYGSKNGWYTTKKLDSEWAFSNSVPVWISALEPEVDEIDVPEDSEEIDDVIPKIIVATEPTELLFTEGPPEFASITGTSVNYVTNSDSVIIRHDGQLYILLSGRWFTSKTITGDWSFVASDKLPDDFLKIPAESEIGGVRYAISGTAEAKEAVLDTYIPQTAKVDRKVATVKVAYDGTPKFEDIPGTGLQYAVNSDQQVLLAKGTFYACVDAVWYVSKKAQGPWSVAIERPEGVEQIPPESPVYNVKYVYIYDVQPDVVYVGYLPGYTGSYVYHTTIVYGTGYYYHPWYRHYYYPRHGTWNFRVRYSPWGGWSFGIGYSTGRFTFGIGVGGHRYHRGYHRGYRRGYHHGVRAGYVAGSHAAQRNTNIYRAQHHTGVYSPDRRTLSQDQKNTIQQNNKNNLYSDRKGDVYKRDKAGSWQKQGAVAQKKQNLDSGASVALKMSVAQQQLQSSTNPLAAQKRPSVQQQSNSLNRDQYARDRGNQRAQQQRAIQNRSSTSSSNKSSRSGGAKRSGGGGRR